MKHLCHVPSCEIEVPRKMLMCRGHWRMVSKLTQHLVWKHYNPGQEVGLAGISQEWEAAAKKAVNEVREAIRKSEA